MIKAIFWDNDGVLVDTEGLFFEANKEILADLGVALSRRQFEEISLLNGQSVLRLAADPETPEFIQLRSLRDIRYAERLAEKSLVIDGVREVLDSLCGKYLMGIVTSSGQEHFDLIHRRSNLLPYFQFVLTLKDCEHTKPHPEPYLKAINKSGFPPEECLVIEDSPRGLASAQAAGIRCIVIPSSFTKGSPFAGAYKVLDHIRHLPAVLADE